MSSGAASPLSFGNLVGTRSDLAIVCGVVGILGVLVLPIPSWLLDFLLIMNLSVALLILLLSFYMDKPLTFSTFPSLLLIATIFRLALNVSATRLILSEADAGDVIHTIGAYVVAGNYVIGLVVFFILIVVQYVVITNGAQRVAEVAARFTLDAMPGKQMSIDAELNLGLITEEQARERRSNIEREANFYGAMDGASKFVKGDAIAGIVIILIDIIGGLSIGMVQNDLAWGEALGLYTLLTVGDGIVTQIPALVIATATGIIVTRAATDSQLSSEITLQVTRYPKSLVFVGVALILALALPGIPMIPVLVLLACVLALLVAAIRRGKGEQTVETNQDTQEREGDEDGLEALMQIDPILVTVGDDLIASLGQKDGVLMRRIAALRKQLVRDLGFVLPKVRIKASRSASREYSVHFYGPKVGGGTVEPEKALAIRADGSGRSIKGTPTTDPSFGLPAYWIEPEQVDDARNDGFTVVDVVTVVSTHISELIKAHMGDLLTRAETVDWLARVRSQQATLVEELVPSVLSLAELGQVLKRLVSEHAPIKNGVQICEVLLDSAPKSKDIDFLVERVREALGRSICERFYDGSDTMHVLTLAHSTEDTVRSSLRKLDEVTGLVLEPAYASALLVELRKSSDRMLNSNKNPVLLSPPSLRRHLRKLTERALPHLAVLSLSEVPNQLSVKSFAVIDVKP